MTVEYLNPPGLPRNPMFSQAVVVPSGSRLVFIGGQDAVDPNGQVVGTTLAEQTVQVLHNVQAAVTAAGGTLHNIVSWRVHLMDGSSLPEALGAFQTAWGDDKNAPALTVVRVAGLARPGLLIEIDAIAAIPE
jgi:enamine deaminase RidA (YjgF/YER057c/UK114 family)